MASKKRDSTKKGLTTREIGENAADNNHKINTGMKDFDEHDLSYSPADISSISQLQKLNNSKATTNHQQIGINSSGILGSPYSNILKSTMKNNNSNNNILDQLINSNAGIDFNTKPSSLIFESNIRNFGNKHGNTGNNNNNEEDLIDAKTQSNNILGDFLLSSPFYNPNFNNNEHSPSSTTNNNHNHNIAWNHNFDLFRTPLKTPVLNLNSNIKSGSTYPATTLKLSAYQQSSTNNGTSTNDINSIHPLLAENNQSPSILRKNAKTLKRQKKRRLKIEVNNENVGAMDTSEEGKYKGNEDLSSEATVDMSGAGSQFEDAVSLSVEKNNLPTTKKDLMPNAYNAESADNDDSKNKKLSLSPISKSLKISGNILPKNNNKRIPLDNSSTHVHRNLPRMGSFSTHSQSRVSSFNSTTVNNSYNQYQHHFTNDSSTLSGNKRNMSVLSNSSQTTNVSVNSHSNTFVNGSIKKPKKKRNNNSNNNNNNNGSNGGKKYQIVLKFPDTFN